MEQQQRQLCLDLSAFPARLTVIKVPPKWSTDCIGRTYYYGNQFKAKDIINVSYTERHTNRWFLLDLNTIYEYIAKGYLKV